MLGHRRHAAGRDAVIASEHERKPPVLQRLGHLFIELFVRGVDLLEPYHVAQAHAVFRRHYVALVAQRIAHAPEAVLEPRVPDGKRTHGYALLCRAEVDLHSDKIYFCFAVQICHAYPLFSLLPSGSSVILVQNSRNGIKHQGQAHFSLFFILLKSMLHSPPDIPTGIMSSNEYCVGR